ncbi:hypothetical protein FF011L_06870 [Roseimaritima multifibrata]|uniref:Uncharacterized protein n=1 Tax=Roseimaritima multifibrata TaxID=1930274 RepID=A0A517MAR7_9BACT|nr:hypothetical protein FF011L_06870 [Roseimaritima multifibrata]
MLLLLRRRNASEVGQLKFTVDLRTGTPFPWFRILRQACHTSGFAFSAKTEEVAKTIVRWRCSLHWFEFQ